MAEIKNETSIDSMSLSDLITAKDHMSGSLENLYTAQIAIRQKTATEDLQNKKEWVNDMILLYDKKIERVQNRINEIIDAI